VYIAVAIMPVVRAVECVKNPDECASRSGILALPTNCVIITYDICRPAVKNPDADKLVQAPRPSAYSHAIGVRRPAATARQRGEQSEAPRRVGISAARDARERQPLPEPRRCRASLATALQNGPPEMARQTLSLAFGVRAQPRPPGSIVARIPHPRTGQFAFPPGGRRPAWPIRPILELDQP